MHNNINPKNTQVHCACQTCGNSFFTKRYRSLDPQRGKFCSKPCYYAHKKTVRKPFAERFWSKVLKTDYCWLWQDRLSSKGYGKIGLGGRGSKEIGAHRAAWILAFGDIPEGLIVRHFVCDNPPCVNPAHLKLGTNADNSRDMVEKGRQSRLPNAPDKIARGARHGSRTRPESTPKGEKHPNAKLTEKEVLQIRQSFATGNKTQVEIAKEFSLTKITIFDIVHRRTWKHI